MRPLSTAASPVPARRPSIRGPPSRSKRAPSSPAPRPITSRTPTTSSCGRFRCRIPRRPSWRRHCAPARPRSHSPVAISRRGPGTRARTPSLGATASSCPDSRASSPTTAHSRCRARGRCGSISRIDLTGLRARPTLAPVPRPQLSPSLEARMNLLRRKSITDLQTEALTDHSLKRALSALNLTMLGIGAIIGTRIFVLTGTVAALNAGPAVVLSFTLAGVASVFAALCYSEFASLVPMAGSAYTYGYATLGELIAWIIGWDLVLEYALGAVTV